MTDMAHDNFTGVINRDGIGLYMKLGGLVLWTYYNLLLYPQSSTLPHRNAWFAGMNICAVLTIVIPYGNPAAVLSNLHVLCANTTIVLLNIIIVLSRSHDFRTLQFYVLLSLPAFLLIFTTMSINGICEIVYAWSMSVYLTYLNTRSSF